MKVGFYLKSKYENFEQALEAEDLHLADINADVTINDVTAIVDCITKTLGSAGCVGLSIVDVPGEVE